MEHGLRRTLLERKERGGFRLRKATFKGRGLQRHAAGYSSEHIREMAYEGHGA